MPEIEPRIPDAKKHSHSIIYAICNLYVRQGEWVAANCPVRPVPASLKV
jgi:hypothetical protein